MNNEQSLQYYIIIMLVKLLNNAMQLVLFYKLNNITVLIINYIRYFG